MLTSQRIRGQARPSVSYHGSESQVAKIILKGGIFYGKEEVVISQTLAGHSGSNRMDLGGNPTSKLICEMWSVLSEIIESIEYEETQKRETLQNVTSGGV